MANIRAPTIAHGVIDFLLFSAVGIVWLVLFFVRPGFCEPGFFCNDLQDISLPFYGDTVSDGMLAIIIIGVSFFSVLVIELICHYNELKHGSWMGLMMAIYRYYGAWLFGEASGLFVCAILKNTTCRMRPHYLYTCQVDWSKVNCSQGYVTEWNCTNTVESEFEMDDLTLSFPSEHSTIVTFAAVYMAYYYQRRIELEYSSLLKLVLQLALATFSVYTMVSRVTDHRHFVSDVLAGALIGFLTAVWIILCLGRELRQGQHSKRQHGKRRQKKRDKESYQEL